MLLEALLAVLILAVGLTIVVRSLGNSLGTLRLSGDYTRAMLLLEEKMWELEANSSINPGSSSGTFSEEDGKFRWQITASPTNRLGLCETKVTVTWNQKGRPRDVSVVTYLRAESGDQG